ncbi:MAG: glycoside hydrolase family 28 protein [Bacteroidetes bacterium]|nr:glycoside hydrolase family 28 protein [Bacteroidota bacterium]
MKLKITLLFFLVFTGYIAKAQIHGLVFDVSAYGAKGDGKTLDSPAINKAIDAAAEVGGGTVYFKAGTYLSYSIHLKSNITLFIDQGATILAADSVGYDPAEPNQWSKYQDFGHSHWHNSLIWGEGLENISILGQGLINGKGLLREADKKPVGTGNKAISLKLCRNVDIRDISILYGGHFAILATGVDNLTIDNLKIDTNRDGMDIDCCRNVRVSNCTVNSPGDDGICLKSCYGLGRTKDTEDVTITNCLVCGFDVGTVFDGTFQYVKEGALNRNPMGRIKFGTESSGGFKNITISNCVFDHCMGLALETVDGGLLEDVSITNITMRNIINGPLFLRLGSRMRSPEGTPIGEMRRINISNLVVYNADPRYGSIISGIPGHDIQDVKLHDIRIYYQGGGTKEEAAINPPEKENGYPDPRMFGPIPSYGFFIRHVKGIEMNNVEISYINEDLRPAFVLNDVKGAEFTNLKAQHATDVPIFVLKDVENLTTFKCKELKDIEIKKVVLRKL